MPLLPAISSSSSSETDARVALLLRGHLLVVVVVARAVQPPLLWKSLLARARPREVRPTGMSFKEVLVGVFFHFSSTRGPLHNKVILEQRSQHSRTLSPKFSNLNLVFKIFNDLHEFTKNLFFNFEIHLEVNVGCQRVLKFDCVLPACDLTRPTASFRFERFFVNFKRRTMKERTRLTVKPVARQVRWSS